MKLLRRNFVLSAGAGLAWPALAADEYPSRPIRLVVPFAPGGSIDFAGRTLGQRMGMELGQPVVIDNVPGAGGVIGLANVARATPDGYTLGVSMNSNTTIPFALGKKVPYDPLKDLTLISVATKNLLCIVVRSDFPARSLKELVAYAKENPGKVSFGTAGPGTTNHLEGESLNQFAGIQMVHVPYRGAALALNDVLAGQVPVGILSVTGVIQHVRSGKLRALAILDPSRFAELPDVPAAPEALPGFPQDVGSWIALAGPAGMPAATVARISAALKRTLEDPATAKELVHNGMPVVGSSGAQYASMVKLEIDTWSRIVRNGKITVAD